jgi:hypothetical protein
MHKLFRFAKEFAADIRKERYEHTEGGILLKRGGVQLTGIYEEGIVGQPDSWRRHKNLIPDAGILMILGIAFYTDAKINAWYLAPFAGSSAVAAGWTAANFTANATEITSNTEGYTEAARQLFVPAAPAAGKVTNTASKANFTIITATQLTITGLGLLSASAKGATSGVLASAVKFGTARVLNTADVWGGGYEVSLTDS